MLSRQQSLALASRLRTMIASAPTEIGQLIAWYDSVEDFRKSLSPEMSNAVPESVWHFLADVDIGLKDAEYFGWRRTAAEKAINGLESPSKEAM